MTISSRRALGYRYAIAGRIDESSSGSWIEIPIRLQGRQLPPRAMQTSSVHQSTKQIIRGALRDPPTALGNGASVSHRDPATLLKPPVYKDIDQGPTDSRKIPLLRCDKDSLIQAKRKSLDQTGNSGGRRAWEPPV
jgi:hypothetical protein